LVRRHTFKMAAMTSARRSQLLLAARSPAERVWRHWLAVCATVPDP